MASTDSVKVLVVGDSGNCLMNKSFLIFIIDVSKIHLIKNDYYKYYIILNNMIHENCSHFIEY